MWFVQQEKLSHTHKNAEAHIESWISTTKSTLGNWVQSRSLTETISWLEYGTENKNEKWFWKRKKISSSGWLNQSLKRICKM